MSINLSDRELGTVLAALRLWQQSMNDVDQDLRTIATSEGNLDPLTEGEIDELCERLNTEPTDKNGNPIYRAVIKVGEATANDLQRMLDRDEQVEGYKRDDVIQSFTAKFGDGIEADIKVCNGDTGAWVDSVLFHEGHEIAQLEPDTTLLGEYPFEHEHATYMVVVEVG